jgi:hypothetical protein
MKQRKKTLRFQQTSCRCTFVPSWFHVFGLLTGDGWRTELPVGDGNCPAGLIREAIEDVCRKAGVVVCVINDELNEWRRGTSIVEAGLTLLYLYNSASVRCS